MKTHVYEVEEKVYIGHKPVFFTNKNEAISFGEKTKEAMKKHGFGSGYNVTKEKTADGKEVYYVFGTLKKSFLMDERYIDFASKEKAEKEIKSFYKDLKDARSIFKISAKISD